MTGSFCHYLLVKAREQEDMSLYDYRQRYSKMKGIRKIRTNLFHCLSLNHLLHVQSYKVNIFLKLSF